MKQYDKIWVPDMQGNADVVVVGNHWEEQVSSKEKVIVLTIEELSELWNAGHSAGMEDAGAILKKPALDFEAYLQSKGITI